MIYKNLSEAASDVAKKLEIFNGYHKNLCFDDCVYMAFLEMQGRMKKSDVVAVTFSGAKKFRGKIIPVLVRMEKEKISGEIEIKIERMEA